MTLNVPTVVKGAHLPAGFEQLTIGQGILLLDQQLPAIGLLLQLGPVGGFSQALMG